MPELQHVMFIEDQTTIFEIIELALVRVGRLQVRGFSSGLEAIANAPSTAPRPQLLLLDAMMPDMDGPTTLAQLRRIEGFETIPAVFLTAKVETKHVDRLRLLGVADVLFKPFDPMSLATQLRSIYAQVALPSDSVQSV